MVNKRVQNAVFGCRLKNDRMISVHFQGKWTPFNIRVIQVYAGINNIEEVEVKWSPEDLQNLWQLTPPKYVFFTIEDLNAKVGSQETPGVTGKFGLGVQNKAGQRIIEFCQENALVIANIIFQKTREDSTHGYHNMVNTKIILIIFFSAKDEEALYSQQKQDQEQTVAQIMNSLLPNSDLNWR